MSAADVINQALQRLRMSDEILEYDNRQRQVLGNEINDSQCPCDDLSSIENTPRT